MFCDERRTIAALAIFGSYLSFQTIVSLYLQNTLQWEPLQMALAMAPTGIIVAILVIVLLVWLLVFNNGGGGTNTTTTPLPSAVRMLFLG